MIYGVHHVSFSTLNLDGMLEFYRDFLGMAVIADTLISQVDLFDEVVGLQAACARGVMLQAGNAFIELWQYKHPIPKGAMLERRPCDVGIQHVCFDVADAHAIYDRLIALGWRAQSSPQHLGSVITFYAFDPDGNVVEMRQGIPGISKVEVSPEILALSKKILGH